MAFSFLYLAFVVVDEDEHVEPTEQHRVDVKEVARHEASQLPSDAGDRWKPLGDVGAGRPG